MIFNPWEEEEIIVPPAKNCGNLSESQSDETCCEPIPTTKILLLFDMLNSICHKLHSIENPEYKEPANTPCDRVDIELSLGRPADGLHHFTSAPRAL